MSSGYRLVSSQTSSVLWELVSGMLGLLSKRMALSRVHILVLGENED